MTYLNLHYLLDQITMLKIYVFFFEIQDFLMAQQSDIQDCWNGNRCSIDEHCGESGGICSISLLWNNENNMNLTSQLQG